MLSRPPSPTLFPYTTLFRSLLGASQLAAQSAAKVSSSPDLPRPPYLDPSLPVDQRVDDLVSRMTLDEKDRKSTRLNSSHITISYAVFCLKKKKNIQFAKMYV